MNKNKNKKKIINVIYIILLILAYTIPILIVNLRINESDIHRSFNFIKGLIYVLIIMGVWKIRDEIEKITAYAKKYIEYDYSILYAYLLAIRYRNGAFKDDEKPNKIYSQIDHQEIDFENDKKEFRQWVKFKKIYDKKGDI